MFPDIDVVFILTWKLETSKSDLSEFLQLSHYWLMMFMKQICPLLFISFVVLFKLYNMGKSILSSQISINASSASVFEASWRST